MRDKSAYLVVQAFQKILDVVLLGRVNTRRPAERRHRSQRTYFNLDLPELGSVRDILAPWSSGNIHLPLVVDLFGSADALGDVGKEPSGDYVLVERWTLHYKEKEMLSSTGGSSSELKAQLRLVLKRIMILLRTIYAFLRILPAHSLVRRGVKASTELFYSIHCSAVASDGGASLLPAPNPIPVPKSSEALRQPKAILDSRVPLAFLEQVSNHAFPEIETPYGTLCVEVYYKEELHLRREDLEKAPGIGEEGVIIQDYYQKSEPKAKEMSGLGRLLAEAQKEPFVPNLGGYNPPTEWLPREPHLTPPPTARPHVIETDPRHFRRRSTAPIGVPSVGLEPDGSGSQGARQGKAQAHSLPGMSTDQEKIRTLPVPPPPPPLGPAGTPIKDSPTMSSPMGPAPPFLCGSSPMTTSMNAVSPIGSQSPPYHTSGPNFHPSENYAMVRYETRKHHPSVHVPPGATSFLPSRHSVAPLPAVVEGGLSSMLVNPFLLEDNPVKLEESMSTVCPVTDDYRQGFDTSLSLPFASTTGSMANDDDLPDSFGSALPEAPVLSSLGGDVHDTDLNDYRQFLVRARAHNS